MTYSFKLTPYIDKGRKSLYPDETHEERRRWLKYKSGLMELRQFLLEYLTSQELANYFAAIGKDTVIEVDDLLNYCLQVRDNRKSHNGKND